MNIGLIVAASTGAFAEPVENDEHDGARKVL